ncbi:MAG: LamG-like jellyroll fold domain-containing protein, partial [Methylophagaceae bacterium]
MDETSGTNAGDYSGNNQNATLNNGVSINQTGQYGTGYSFDGVDDNIYVLSSNLINLMTVTDRSYSLNFNANDVTTRQIIYEEGAQVNGLNIYILNNKLYAGAYSEANSWQGSWMEHSISANIWYSVVFIFSNSGNMELYVNGISVATSTGGTAVRTHSGSIGIGGMIQASKFHDIGDEMGDGNYFNGFIDDLGIWNRALTPAEAVQMNSRAVINNNSPLGDEINTDGGNYTITPLGPGDYTITVTDENGCAVVLTQTITEPALLTATATKIQDVTCNGAADGSITVVGTGGTVATDYTYLWDDAAAQTTATA